MNYKFFLKYIYIYTVSVSYNFMNLVCLRVRVRVVSNVCVGSVLLSEKLISRGVVRRLNKDLPQ